MRLTFGEPESAEGTPLSTRAGGVSAPPITVAVPVFNGERYLAGALGSILNQRDAPQFEVLVADNCSTDGTGDIVRSLARQDPRVRYVRRTENVGVQTNHNMLVHEAHGEYLLWAAHDDESEPTRLSRLHAALATRPDAVGAVSSVQEIDVDGRPLHIWHNNCRTAGPDPVRRLHDYLRFNTTTLHVYALMRRDVLRRTAMMGLSHQGDRLLLAELLLHGPLVDVREPLLRHRLHENRLSERLDPREFAQGEASRRGGDPLTYLPNIDELVRYLGVLRRAPLSGRDRTRALLALRPWLRANTLPMARNVARATHHTARRLTALGGNGAR